MRVEFAPYVAERTPRLTHTAYLLCRDWATAEDLVQTTLTKAWLHWAKISDDPDPYVYKILVNANASWWRRRWHGELPTEELPEQRSETVFAEDRDVLWAALGRLGRRERAAVVLRYFNDLDHAAIGEILGCPAGTVRSQISRALARLRVDPAVLTAREGI